MRLLMCLVILLTSLPAMAQVNIGLQNQLVKMAEQNQQVRQSLIKYDPENVPIALQSVATEINNLYQSVMICDLM